MYDRVVTQFTSSDPAAQSPSHQVTASIQDCALAPRLRIISFPSLAAPSVVIYHPAGDQQQLQTLIIALDLNPTWTITGRAGALQTLATSIIRDR